MNIIITNINSSNFNQYNTIIILNPNHNGTGGISLSYKKKEEAALATATIIILRSR